MHHLFYGIVILFCALVSSVALRFFVDFFLGGMMERPYLSSGSTPEGPMRQTIKMFTVQCRQGLTDRLSGKCKRRARVALSHCASRLGDHCCPNQSHNMAHFLNFKF